MILTALGTGAGMVDPERHFPAFHVRSRESNFLIDAGEGVTRQLMRYRLDPKTLKAVFISHSHADHLGGLPMLLQCMHLDRRTGELIVYVPSGIYRHMALFLGLFQIYPEKWSFPVRFEPLKHGALIEYPDFRLRALVNGHLDSVSESARRLGLESDAYSFHFHEQPDYSVLYTSDIPSFGHLEQTGDIYLLLAETTHVTIDEINRFAALKGIGRTAGVHIPRPKPGGKTRSSFRWLKDGDTLQIPEPGDIS